MGNYNSKYFDKKDGSLEEAIRMAVTKEIKEAKIVMDLENDDPKLIKDIKKFGLKVKDLGFSGNDGYNEYEVSGPQAKIDAANKKLNLMAGHNMNKIGEKLDPVNKKALKKDFDDRKDKDIDNDGDVDSSDKYLAKRRKAVSKAMQSEDMQTKSYINDIASAMKKDKIMKPFADKFKKDAMKTMNPKKSLEDVLPDYVAGKDIAKLLNMGENYDIGTPENTKSKLDATPGQSSDDWNQQVEIMQKKQASMREALAKVWGVDEGHNPFAEEPKYPHMMYDPKSGKEVKAKTPEDHKKFAKMGYTHDKPKKEQNTMTGKPMTKVSVEPDMKEKKN